MVWKPHQHLLHSKENPVNRLNEEHSIALLYHDVFGYPMRERELVKWEAGRALRLLRPKPRVMFKDGYFFLKGKGALVSARLHKEYISKEKMKLLARAKHIFEQSSGILMVGITGSLAMAAARGSSDIDLMIITKKGRLWSTRLKVLFSLLKNKIAIRRARVNKQADRLCLNIWMDEEDLSIESPRNAYTAHELAQIVPLINRETTYERLLAANKWILDYWPNAIALRNFQFSTFNKKTNLLSFVSTLIEKSAYFLQRVYMAKKWTREVVTPTRAFFHPFDWSKKMVKELEMRGVLDKGQNSS
jgi:predicted nucleotidyltransferase